MTLQDLLEILEEERVPVLVSIKPFGYHHFVVVRGIQGNRIFLADPALGNMTMTLARFEDVWVDGIGFVLTKRPLAKAPGAAAPDEVLATITAAGAPSRSKPSPSNPGPSSPLAIRPTEPVPDNQQLRPFFERGASPEVPRFAQSLPDDRGTEIFTRFTVQRFNPAVQLGRPAGNFIDFTPPNGQPIRSNTQ